MRDEGRVTTATILSLLGGFLPGACAGIGLCLLVRRWLPALRRKGSGASAEQSHLTAIVNQVPVVVWVLGTDNRLLFVNDGYEILSGRNKALLYADPSTFQQLIHPDDRERVWRIVANRDDTGGYEMNYRIVRDDGEIRYLREIGRGVRDGQGRLLYHIGSAMDITSEMVVRDELHELNSRLREANLRLRESARLDNLTRCLNRNALFEEAETALQLERRYGRSSTLIFFDLNDFKRINDNFGHHIGDCGLVAFAEQIKVRLRATDELTRYGGDEFVALLRETDGDQARQLLAAFGPVMINNGAGGNIALNFAAGLACSDQPGIRSVDDWIRMADSQMYAQKMRCESS